MRGRRQNQKGQALILVLVGLSIFLLGALGIAIDGSNLYSHRQMLQAAADSAAQAGVMSLFNKTNTGANVFGASAFTCTTTDVRTPCVYARQNGVGANAEDTIEVSFPNSSPGVNLSPTDNPALINVTITRNVTTGLVRFVAPAAASIKVSATAAIVDIVAPVPIIVTHPTLSGSFSKNGSNTIIICGGPKRSIQVNSSSSTSISISGVSGTVDLSHAGPDTTPGLCNGSGGDFGDFGGPSTYPGTIYLGSNGRYIQPASPIRDPLAPVAPPANPGPAPAVTTVAQGSNGCPATMSKRCQLYSPGAYPAGITVKNDFALFKPGIYYITGGGFHLEANGVGQMATGFGSHADTGQGMVVYNTGNASKDVFEIQANSGQNGGVQYGNSFLGAPNGSIYKGILFFQDRTSAAHLHSMHGGGGLTLRGTIYLTNTEAVMRANAAQYQAFDLQGTPGSSTQVIGEIIVSTLSLGGNANITMTLDPGYTLNIRQVALVR
ncbi:MAG: pilus assembly protein TadG-related protein [Bryobacteraceae bacterium]